MGKGPPQTDIERGRILGLYESGFSLRKIARHVKRSRDAVHQALYVEQDERPKLGPVALFSDRDFRLLVRTASKGLLSVRQLNVELNLAVS
ncbi:hypothetical protein F442_22976, partial [Phytophthora nicotianae P10297]